MVGATHKRLRAAMQIGFTSSAVRECLPLFERIAQGVKTLDTAHPRGVPDPTVLLPGDRTIWRIGRITGGYYPRPQ